MRTLLLRRHWGAWLFRRIVSTEGMGLRLASIFFLVFCSVTGVALLGSAHSVVAA